ncbi:M23 family metallopeptidase [Inquilinus sp. NPDC058860]|uniref:M23 family metallopeptidase n=1 Tax=Inquilinus sp. NPDC058860 TaxID=3346652 RepID=UPI0036B7B266
MTEVVSLSCFMEALMPRAPTIPNPPAWTAPSAPAQVGGVPFAPAASGAVYWPIRTTDRRGREVNYEEGDGDIVTSNASRRFMAPRGGGARHHAGVDLWGKASEIIRACESGTIVNFYHFYLGTYALLIQCDSGIVINYGEVAPDSLIQFGLNVGSKVNAGDKIGRVGLMSSGSQMCHFETYISGTIQNSSWKAHKPRPPSLLNPTQYLIDLAARGS